MKSEKNALHLYSYFLCSFSFQLTKWTTFSKYFVNRVKRFVNCSRNVKFKKYYVITKETKGTEQDILNIWLNVTYALDTLFQKCLK